ELPAVEGVGCTAEPAGLDDAVDPHAATTNAIATRARTGRFIYPIRGQLAGTPRINPVPIRPARIGPSRSDQESRAPRRRRHARQPGRDVGRPASTSARRGPCGAWARA